MDFKPVKDREELLRDPCSKAIINTDDSAYERRKAQKAAAARRNQESLNDKKRISDLENEMSEMRQLMQAILTQSK